MLYPDLVLQKAARIKLLLLDVDGVLTNGQVFLSADGDEIKPFHTQDGYGLKCIKHHGIEVGIISGRNSLSCARRMQELGVNHVFQGIREKLPIFETLISTLQLNETQCAYVGDDIPDIPIMQRAGLKIAVSNATPPLKAIVDWETTLPGGHGAVREVCDLLLHAQNMGYHYAT